MDNFLPEIELNIVSETIVAKSEIISLSVPVGTKKKFQDIAKHYNTSVSEIFRRLIGLVDLTMVVPIQNKKPSLSEFTDEELLEECQKRLAERA